ncbi:unnamed protein product [Macrosiphum euphorbiae]|uniref:Uncharacterized protein n=1 Tax=Macrosiphum euphorbiae TaxID=13131 RepID=A0AAV0VWG0_9HEMI|nr:unnamed protein product [Macrosiphum euphorbiae]
MGLFIFLIFWESLDARVSYSISCLSALFITAVAATIPLHQINRHRSVESLCIVGGGRRLRAFHSQTSRAGSDRWCGGRRTGGGGDVELVAVMVVR